jgi:hypothetical protein
MTKQNHCSWEGQGEFIYNSIKGECFPSSLHPGDVERIAAATLRAVAKLPWTKAPVSCHDFLLNFAKDLEELK